MVQVKAEYLADAVSVGHELAFMMECHPETYRECNPKTTVEERMSELGWLWTVFDNAIEKGTLEQKFLSKPWLSSGKTAKAYLDATFDEPPEIPPAN